jgi:chromosome partitioning protein
MRIAVTTGKGGTGKTTTAMALSSALARIGKRVLLIDLDPQANSTIGLGVEVRDSDLTVRDIFQQYPAPIERVIRHTEVGGLDIVPSTGLLKITAENLLGRRRKEYVLEQALLPAASRYEYIVMDCPHWLGALTDNAIAAADFIIVPCQMEARARDGLVDLLEAVADLKGPRFDQWGILLIKVDPRKKITNETVMATLRDWERKVFQTRIPVCEPLNQAQLARQDIYTFDPKCSGALAYQAFTEEILNHGRHQEETRGARPRRRPQAEAGQAPQ